MSFLRAKIGVRYLSKPLGYHSDVHSRRLCSQWQTNSSVVLHIVHIGAVAVARSRQEANLAFLGLNVAGRIPQQTSGNGFLLYIPKMGEMLDLLIFTL